MTMPCDKTQVNSAAQELGEHLDFVLSPTALYFAATTPVSAVVPRDHAWTCVFALMKQIQSGTPAAFSAANPGCVGAASYLGFNTVPVVPAALFLSHKERLKKDAGLAAAFYNSVEPARARDEHLVLSRLDEIPDDGKVEVVNLWLNAQSISAMHALANYDRPTNDNVIMPFASGCQSIWTIPYKEKRKEFPKAVVGSLDPTVRKFLPGDVISFSAPANRFITMCANIEGSFMAKAKNGARLSSKQRGGGPGNGDQDVEILEPSWLSANALNLSALLKYFST
ncbi:MAG: DUF169 domain-containing protein [Thermoleophilia bacterium]